MLGFRQFLSEAKVNLGGGANYGQVVLLMGGAGSEVNCDPTIRKHPWLQSHQP